MKVLLGEAEKALKMLAEKEKEERKFYSISEMARLTGMNANVIWKLVDRGEIPAIRIGKKYLIPAEILSLSHFSFLKTQKI